MDTAGSTHQPRAEASVRFAGLKKSFGNTQALAGIDAEIACGELFGFVGPDGAGKTTLLQILAGVMPATAGDVSVLAANPQNSRLQVGYLTQHFSLYGELSIEENLRYHAGIRNVPDSVYQPRRDALLDRVGLMPFTQRLAGHLSGGMKQKLALCCALISDPELLLLDEPTTGLDPLARAEVWQLIDEIAGEGKTVIIATPHFDEAQRCNRVALMQSGCLIKTGKPAELVKELNTTRLEIRSSELHIATRLLVEAHERRERAFDDINLYGDRLDLLAGDPDAAGTHIETTLTAAGMSSFTVSFADPTLENVYLATLRARGIAEPEAIRFPHAGTKNELAAGEIAIQCHELTKRFNDFTAVDKVSLDIRQGEIFGLLGANGAGKTTTIQMLTGLIKPSSGSVRTGSKYGSVGSGKFRRRLGYMSQKFTLYDDLTVAENLAFYASAYSIDSAVRQQRIDWVLSMCDLHKLHNTLVRDLPRGLRQRIAFGASVMHEPQLLFLDEPTAGIDPLARRQLWRIIRDFAEHGCAVVVTTHFLDDAEYCHRLGVMVEGRLAAQGSPGEIKLTAGHQYSSSLEEAFISVVRQTREMQELAKLEQSTTRTKPA